jgi:hypothetical protein
MADLRDIAKAHKTGTISMPSGPIENESDYNSKVIVEDVTKLTWSELQAEMAKVAYIDKRKVAYASLGDQLDMRYKDLLNGTTTWKDHVAKVKSDHPKPE